MANNLVPAATTIFLLLLTLTTADTDSDLVLDVDGNPLEVGSEYYIQRAGIGFFGGIGRSPRGAPCPLYVDERLSEVDRGNPVKFVPVDETQKEIHLSSDVQIDSGFSAYCRSDGFWSVSFDAYTRGEVIIAAGAFGVPRSSFRMEKIEEEEGSLNAYQITYTPPTIPQQRYLTVFRDHLSGLNLVGLTGDSTQAVPFAFHKNKKDVVASI